MNETTTTEATAILAPLWKRKWVILLAGLLVAGGTYLYYKRKPDVFQASTQIYLAAGEEQGAAPASPSKGKKHGKKTVGSSSSASNQAVIINSPLVREIVNRRLARLHTSAARAALRGSATAKAPAGSPFMPITAQAQSARGAALLANTVTQTYIKRQVSQSQAAIKAQIAQTRSQLRAVELAPATPVTKSKSKGKKSKSAGGAKSSSPASTLQVVTLNTKLNQLESQLTVVGIKQVSPARPAGAKLIYPMPKKNAIFGFVIGLFLASLAAYFFSRFDRRLRTLAAIEAVFQTPILAALPSARRPIVRRGGRLAPAEALSEPLRRLHTSLQLSAAGRPEADGALALEREHPHRSILFLSPDAGDGKSTVVASLALVQRDWGERVAVVEADFRRPVQARLLEVTASHGLAEVLSGALGLEEAIQPAESAPSRVSTNSRGSGRPLATVVEARSTGALSVLVGHTGVSNPPALLASRSMAGLLASLADEADYTLVDAPSPLRVSDAMPLLPVVDGIVLVARAGHTREISARRLMQILAQSHSAPVLGTVVNDVSRAEQERYGFYSPGERRWLGKLIAR